MPRKTSEKNNSQHQLEVSISPILVVNSSRYKPYIESFSYHPSNIIEQPLGNLLGFFRIRDESDDSAYIVNFLASVVKKEYYINPRRSVEDSFDLALHKANVALSELAKNGNINWMGTLDAAVCVVEKNKFHFGVTGNAKIILLRNEVLTDISEGLASVEEEPHPIKTFTNVSSGSISQGDKMIVTSDDIFRIFSLTELKKNALRFPSDKFVQFLNTALVNELDVAETIVIDVKEKERKKQERRERDRDLSNVFSQKTFERIPAKKIKEKLRGEEEKKIDYVDKKTGHIYVQEEQGIPEQRSKLSLYWFVFCERWNDFFFPIKSKLRRKLSLSLNRLRESVKDKFKRKKEKIFQPTAAKVETASIGKGGRFKTGIKTFMAKITSPIKNAFLGLKNKIRPAGPKEIIEEKPAERTTIFPSPNKIKEVFSSLTYQQKLYGILVVIAIVFIPLIYLRVVSEKSSTPRQEAVSEANLAEILANDKNINLSSAAQIIHTGRSLKNVEVSDDKLVFVSDKKIYIGKDNGELEEYSLPDDKGNMIASSSMGDLNLVFFLTDQGKIFSFSPISRELKENGIAVPENADIKLIGTYLTYIYLVDPGKSKIHRYPRSEGGFGDLASWLKEEINLKNVNSMAIDENIYLADGNSLIKLFSGKKQDFSPEQSATPINFDGVFTNIDLESIYVLDRENARVVAFSKEGEVLNQYYHELLKNAKDFVYNTSDNKIYFITSDGNTAGLAL